MSICITLGEQSENHAGMIKYGDGLSEKGYSIEELNKVKDAFEKCGGECELIRFDVEKDWEEAGVLVLRNGVGVLGEDGNEIFKELKDLDWDKKYWDGRRKKVLNKHARWNLCFGDVNEEPDYENKKGRVVKCEGMKLGKWKSKVEEFMRECVGYFQKFECEGNYYYKKECGIGFHGDGERKRVIGGSFGDDRKLVWIWYKNSKRVSDRFEIVIRSGDMYIMSEKASGWDWKYRSKITLRHAAGGDKYIK